jgi:FixJ family two-component response regulator
LPDSTASVICLLDDDPSVLKGLGRLLTSAGWRAELFSDPEKFFHYARTYRTPVAILDVWMPLMNGLEVQSRLRQISPSTRVIMFTGKDDPSIRSNALTGGATAFFAKPFDDEEFLTAVRFALAGT